MASIFLISKLLLKQVKAKYPDDVVQREPSDAEIEHSKNLLSYLELAVQQEQSSPSCLLQKQDIEEEINALKVSSPTGSPQNATVEHEIENEPIASIVDSPIVPESEVSAFEESILPESEVSSGDTAIVPDSAFDRSVIPDSETSDSPIIPDSEAWAVNNNSIIEESDPVTESEPITTTEQPESVQITAESESVSVTLEVSNNPESDIKKEESLPSPVPAITDLRECPKLKQKTTVVLTHLSKGTAKQLKKKAGRISLNNLDPLELELLKAEKYNPIITKSKSETNKTKEKPKKSEKKTDKSDKNETFYSILESDDDEEASQLQPSSALAGEEPSLVPEIDGLEQLSDEEDMEIFEPENEEEEIPIIAVESDDSDFVPTIKRVLPKSKIKMDKEKTRINSDSDEPFKISSDSESDFEPKTTKSTKRNRHFSESSDASKKSIKNSKSQKKRRRIKIEPSSDTEDVSVSENNKEPDSDIEEIKPSQSSPKKKIRRVLSKKELEKTTRQAAREEEDRKRRVIEKQKLYNAVFCPEIGSGARVTELVLDFDKTSKKALLSVDPSIVKNLKPHQVEGIKFIWDACFESLEALKKNKAGGGCILAHCMGLGKTLQSIAFLHAVMTSSDCNIKRALVICPLNTVGNWYNEFRHWCSDCDVQPRIHQLWDFKGKRRYHALTDWEKLGGVGIIHYDLFRTLANSEDKKRNRPTQKELGIIRTALLDPGPDIVLCDEGHLLKNDKTQQAKAVMKIRTKRRIVLTGTPLQNNLQEYHTMMSFVKPNLLGTKKEFANRFVNPIAQGQARDSDDQDVRLMKRRAHVLHKLLEGCVQRLDYTVLTPYLPPKHEYAILINLSQIQKELISHYLKNMTPNASGGTFKTSQLFKDYQALVKIWTHPVVLTFKKTQDGITTDSDAGSLKDFICDDETTTDVTSDASDNENTSKTSRTTRNKKRKDETHESVVDTSAAATSPGPWYMQFVQSEEDLHKLELSGKMTVLFEILKECEGMGDKVLVFSQFLTSLDLIESYLAEIDQEAEAKINQDEERSYPPGPSSSVGRYRPNMEYFRLDGSTRTGDRQKSCDTFNASTASRAKLFLISTKAGGLGINLTGANRVVIFDASWNPSHDLQSIFRVYRFGQKKPCYIYRLLARGTMEEKIYNRQVVKLSLSCRVVDEQQIERHFHFDEIRDMYKFNTMDTTERPIPIVPKDRLLAELLINEEQWIFKYLEHDSLLENKQEEELTEEERKAAWDEYQIEEASPRQKNVPVQYGNDDWNNHMFHVLRQRYPTATDQQIITQVFIVRQKFDHLSSLHKQMATAKGTPKADIINTELMARAKEMKEIFGDDVNWNKKFFEPYDHKLQQAQKIHQESQRRLQEMLDSSRMQNSAAPAYNQGYSSNRIPPVNPVNYSAAPANTSMMQQRAQPQVYGPPGLTSSSMLSSSLFGPNFNQPAASKPNTAASSTSNYPRMLPNFFSNGNTNNSRPQQKQPNETPIRHARKDPVVIPDLREPESILPD